MMADSLKLTRTSERVEVGFIVIDATKSCVWCVKVQYLLTGTKGRKKAKASRKKGSIHISGMIFHHLTLESMTHPRIVTTK